MNSSNKLKMPETPPVSVTVDATEAYVKSVMMIPGLLSELVDRLDDVANALSIVALYCEKRGLNEAILAPDDLEQDGGDGQQPAA